MTAPGGLTEVLRARLSRLGMTMDASQLGRAEAIVRRHTERPFHLADITLMSIAVEAYRSDDTELNEVV